MLFNSIDFMLFFPLIVLIYFIIPKKAKNYWLLFGSYYFYMGWNPRYVILLFLSTLVTYIAGVAIQLFNDCKTLDGKRKIFIRKLCLITGCVINFGILVFFKYFNFILENVYKLLLLPGIEITERKFDILLPVGISFYTFQAVGYMIDVYRRDIYAEKNFFRYALFVSFFPQLVAGPIERSKNLLTQLDRTYPFDYARIRKGLLVMLWGFFLKMVIADRSALLVNTVYNGYQSYYGIALILANLLFAVQIYCDFYGYSTIAKGAALVLGYELMDNFCQPYLAGSIREFWRRWHISLSSWLKDYIYIPLGGSRCTTLKKYRNIMITFLVSGLWHGASWNFVVWGGVTDFIRS